MRVVNVLMCVAPAALLSLVSVLKVRILLSQSWVE